MPEHDKEHDNTSMPEEAEKLLSDLYSQTRDEPMNTTALDDKILAAAREELAREQTDNRQQKSKKPSNIIALSGWRRWSTPVASAACLLLGVSLTFNFVLYQQTGDQTESLNLQAPLASIQTTESVTEAGENISRKESQEFAFEQSAAPIAKRKLATEQQRQPVNGLMAAKPQAVSAAEADDIFEDFAAEIKIASSNAPQEKTLKPDLERRVDGIIKLLKNGQLADARQQLMLLIEEYPELTEPKQ